MENQTADTIIGVDVNVKGNLNNKSSVQVNGTVEGEIKSDENVTVGETAVITGPVTAKNILISGRVDGTITAHEKLEVDPTGRIGGDIKTKVLIFREGASFNGTCAMVEEKKPAQVEEKKDVTAPAQAPVSTPVEEKKEQSKGGFWDKGKRE